MDYPLIKLQPHFQITTQWRKDLRTKFECGTVDQHFPFQPQSMATVHTLGSDHGA